MTRLWRARDGSLHRIDDPYRHLLTKAQKKRLKRARHPRVPYPQQHNHPKFEAADVDA